MKKIWKCVLKEFVLGTETILRKNGLLQCLKSIKANQVLVFSFSKILKIFTKRIYAFTKKFCNTSKPLSYQTGRGSEKGLCDKSNEVKILWFIEEIRLLRTYLNIVYHWSQSTKFTKTKKLFFWNHKFPSTFLHQHPQFLWVTCKFKEKDVLICDTIVFRYTWKLQNNYYGVFIYVLKLL